MMIVTIVTKACATPRRLTWFTKQFSLCKSESLGRVSLIAGLEYGMERWNGKWIRMVNVCNYANLCNWHCSYRKSCISQSSVAGILPCLIISLSETPPFPTIGIAWNHPLLLSNSTIHGNHTYYCQGRLLLITALFEH